MARTLGWLVQVRGGFSGWLPVALGMADLAGWGWLAVVLGLRGWLAVWQVVAEAGPAAASLPGSH
jgi:hypothetical protein